MQVCFISPEYTPNIYGGLGRHTTDLAHFLAVRNVQVHVVTHRTGDTLLDEQPAENLFIHRVCLPFRMEELDWNCKMANLNCAYIWRTLQVISTSHIDILHAQDWGVVQSICGLKRLTSVPVVGTIHGHLENENHPLYQYRNSQIQTFIDSCDALICCSQYMRKELESKYGCADKMNVVPNGVLLERFPFVDKPGDDILFVGRLVPRKGVHELIEAFHLIEQEIPGNLVIVGGGSPAYETQLGNLAMKLNIAHRIHFEGYCDHRQLGRYMQNARLFAIPSLYEPFGIVALEAMASGIPVVAYDVGGLSEIIDDQKTGFKIHVGDIDRLANQLKYVYENIDLLDVLRRQARQKVEQLYTWERVAEMTQRIYEELQRAI